MTRVPVSAHSRLVPPVNHQPLVTIYGEQCSPCVRRGRLEMRNEPSPTIEHLPDWLISLLAPKTSPKTRLDKPTPPATSRQPLATASAATRKYQTNLVPQSNTCPTGVSRYWHLTQAPKSHWLKLNHQPPVTSHQPRRAMLSHQPPATASKARPAMP
jgi:hypothetical protein